MSRAVAALALAFVLAALAKGWLERAQDVARHFPALPAFPAIAAASRPAGVVIVAPGDNQERAPVVIVVPEGQP